MDFGTWTTFQWTAILASCYTQMKIFTKWNLEINLFDTMKHSNKRQRKCLCRKLFQQCVLDQSSEWINVHREISMFCFDVLQILKRELEWNLIQLTRFQNVKKCSRTFNWLSKDSYFTSAFKTWTSQTIANKNSWKAIKWNTIRQLSIS